MAKDNEKLKEENKRLMIRLRIATVDREKWFNNKVEQLTAERDALQKALEKIYRRHERRRRDKLGWDSITRDIAKQALPGKEEENPPDA